MHWRIVLKLRLQSNAFSVALGKLEQKAETSVFDGKAVRRKNALGSIATIKWIAMPKCGR